ncbi:MAG: cytochrome c oxidase assembly protein [Gammaproteobacteria bacterium]
MNFGAGFFLPYVFEPTVLVLCVAAVVLYTRGLVRRRRAGKVTAWPRALAFFLGVVFVYAVLQTHFDYMAQHLFFLHRTQHLFLHHLAPFLIMLSAPGAILAAGVPERFRVRFLRPVACSAFVRWPYRAIQQPIVAGLLFVGLIYLWLIPFVHFYAMLNIPLYNTMNWSMAVDGLLFWYLIFCSPKPRDGGMHYGWRILLLAAVIPPQIVVGAYIALCGKDLYPIYATCGRLWPISPTTDQSLGGLITWIPSAMMSVIGAIVVIHRWMHEDDEPDEELVTEPATRDVPASVPEPEPQSAPSVSAVHARDEPVRSF